MINMPANQNKIQEAQKESSIATPCRGCKKPCLKSSLMSSVYYERASKEKMLSQKTNNEKKLTGQSIKKPFSRMALKLF